MNTDQIKALKERADKATSLAREHEVVSEAAEPYEFEPAEPPVKPEPENASPGVFSSSAIWKYST